MGNRKSEIPGTLELWNPGTLELWNPGTLEPWNSGTLTTPILSQLWFLYFFTTDGHVAFAIRLLFLYNIAIRMPFECIVKQLRRKAVR